MLSRKAPQKGPKFVSKGALKRAQFTYSVGTFWPAGGLASKFFSGKIFQNQPIYPQQPENIIYSKKPCKEHLDRLYYKSKNNHRRTYVS